MKKNYFFLILALFVTASMFSACGQAQGQRQGQVEQEKRFTIQLWSVNRAVGADFAGTIAALAEMGYTGVEMFGYRDGQWFGMAPAEVRRIVEDAGMEMVSSHVNRALAPNPEDTDWDAIWAFWDMAFDAHIEAGIKYLVDPAVGGERLQTLEHVLAYAEYFNEIGRRANARGLRFGYHNHAWELEIMHDGQSVWDILIENTCPELVFFQLDLYWVVRARNNQYILDLFDRFPGRFHSLHVKDTGALGAPDIGIMDFPLVFNNLENSGAMHMIIEIERVEDQMEAARQSIEYLRSVAWFRNNYLE
jgi:sugar phosphate isomerase/epimerase